MSEMATHNRRNRMSETVTHNDGWTSSRKPRKEGQSR